MRNQIIILAAGKGARMGTGDTPKVLLMLNNKPLILYLLDELEHVNKLADSVVVVGHKYRQVMDVLGDGYIYAHQDRQLGTGHAVMCAEPKVKADNVLVLYGDMPFIKAQSLKRLMQLHHTSKSVVTMFTSTVENFQDYPSLLRFGRIIRDAYGNVVKITEYKDASPSERNIREVNPGIYMFNSAWLWGHIHTIQNRNQQQEYYLTDIVEVAFQNEQQVQSLPIHPREVVGINTLEELRWAEKALKKTA